MQIEGLAVLGAGAALAERAGPQRQSNTARRLGVIATVWPAGQVTVLACRSTVKSSLVNPPGTAAGSGIGLIVWTCPAAVSAARVAPLP
jgi:hypothetical protein